MKSNQSSIYGDRKSENIGLAVFKEDKLVGELNNIEALCYYILQNDVRSFFITVKNPQSNDTFLDLNLYLEHPPIIKVQLINQTPFITINCKFDGKIYSANNNSNYLEDNTLEEISKEASRHIKQQMNNYLYKTAKLFKSDINGFGKYARSEFINIKDFENYNWPDSYCDSFFKVTCDVKIRSGFLITET